MCRYATVSALSFPFPTGSGQEWSENIPVGVCGREVGGSVETSTAGHYPLWQGLGSAPITDVPITGLGCTQSLSLGGVLGMGSESRVGRVGLLSVPIRQFVSGQV